MGGWGGCVCLDKSVYYLKKCLLTGINSLKLAYSESHGSTCRRRWAHYILTKGGKSEIAVLVRGWESTS